MSSTKLYIATAGAIVAMFALCIGALSGERFGGRYTLNVATGAVTAVTWTNTGNRVMYLESVALANTASFTVTVTVSHVTGGNVTNTIGTVSVVNEGTTDAAVEYTRTFIFKDETLRFAINRDDLTEDFNIYANIGWLD